VSELKASPGLLGLRSATTRFWPDCSISRSDTATPPLKVSVSAPPSTWVVTVDVTVCVTRVVGKEVDVFVRKPATFDTKINVSVTVNFPLETTVTVLVPGPDTGVAVIREPPK
jgi:hypothetical protein